MTNSKQHDDFGEKIGGAKKDLWQKRGLYSGDLLEMNEREAEKYVKKDNVWKKPDYGAMIDGGIPADVVYYIKKVRDSLDTAPTCLRADDSPEKRLARQMQYVDTVREVQGVMESVQVRSDAFTAFHRCMVDTGYFERLDGGISGPRYNLTDKGKMNPAITQKLVNTLHVRSEIRFDYDFARKAAKEQFGVSKEQKIPKGFEVLLHDGKNSWSKHDDWTPGTYFVAKGHRILQANFETKDAAVKWAQTFAQQRSDGGKQRFFPPQLEHIRRDGPDYRRGRNVGGQDYMDAFAFKGGEFGNWMSQNDRQAALNMGYDALMDLAAALKISDKDISYQGALSIAFGARGSGGAVAHYEPMRQVINLTKMNGAGSLAHEWWHGLDDQLGQKAGVKDLLSEHPHKHPLMAKLIDTIKYKPETPEQAAARAGKQDAQTVRNAEGWLKSAMHQSIHRTGDEKVIAAYESLKDAFLRGEPGSVDKLNDLKKSAAGRVIPKEDRERLHTFERILNGMSEPRESAIGRVATDYYRDSKRMGQISEKDGDYWDSNVEMTARAFATYIMDALPGRSDYLAGHAECAVAFDADKDGNLTILKAYPQGEERAAINAVFDEIVADLKLQQVFTHDEHAQPELRPREPHAHPEIGPDTPGEQLTLDMTARQEKPSVMDKLAAAKEAAGKAAAAPSIPKKAHDTEL